MTEQPLPDEEPGGTLSPEELATRWRAYDDTERQEVIANLRNFGEFAHPDDPPGHGLYLRQRYVGTGLIEFLRRVEGKPPRRLRELD